MIKFNLYFTTSKLMAFLIFIWLFVVSIGLIIAKQTEHIVALSGSAILAITTIISIKNLSKKKDHEIIE